MKRLLWWMIFLIIIGSGIGLYFFRFKKVNGRSSTKPVYNVEIAQRGNIEVKVLATGTIQPYTRVEIRPPIAGRLEEVFFDERAYVKAGAVLARLSSDERISLIDAARAQLESALKSKDEKAIADAKRALEVAERAYKPILITAPISGEIIKRNCQPGQNVYVSDILFVIADRLVASVEVDEADIAKIDLGFQATITLDAYPNEPLVGRVAKISREGRNSSGVVVYDVLVEVDKVPRYWSSGMTANAEFLIIKRDSVLVLRKDLINSFDGKSFVTVLVDGKPQRRLVQTGVSDGTKVEIVSGVAEGDSIVVFGGAGGRGGSTQNVSPMWMMRRLGR